MTESVGDIKTLLEKHGYQNFQLEKNSYGGYDIVYGYQHKCVITNNDHDHINGFIFKTDTGELMSGCYSEQCRKRYKRLICNTQSQELAKLIDKAADQSTHHAIAAVAAYLYKDAIKYAGHEGWYHFNKSNGLWKHDAPAHTLRILLSTGVSDEFSKRIMDYNELMRGTLNQAEKDRCDNMIKKLANVISKLGDGYQKDKLIKEAQTMLYDEELLDKMDEGMCLGFDDGVFDFTTLEFRIGTPEDYVSLSVGYPFPREVDVEHIDAVYNVFRAPFDSGAMADYVLKSLASCLDGRRLVAELFIWSGSGSNGKSTVQELVLATMGKYAHQLDISLWTRPKGAAGSALPELADKRSSRFTFSNELESSDKLQVAKLKEVTGGEKVTARKLYGNPITFRPKFGIFILTNTLPELSKVDGGISRRLRIIPFKHQFKQFPIEGQRQADPQVMHNCRCEMKY